MLVVSSSLFLTNPFAYAGNGPELGGQFAMFGAVGGDQELLMFADRTRRVPDQHDPLAQEHARLDERRLRPDRRQRQADRRRQPDLQDVDQPKFGAEDDEDEIKKKDEEYRQARKSQQISVQWALTLGLPLVVAGFGVLRWRRRQSRKDQYKLSASA